MQGLVRPTVPEPRLLLEWPAESKRAPAWALSLVLHVAAVIGLMWVPRSILEPPERVIQSHLATPLIAPPGELTQTAANRGRVGHNFTLESLMAHTHVTAPRVAPSVPPPPEPPKVEAPALASAQAPPLGTSLTAAGPPAPQIQPEETPQLTFETPGAPSSLPGAGPLSPNRVFGRSRGAVDQAIHSAVRPGSGSVAIGDLDVPGAGDLGAALSLPSSRGRPVSSLELLSDPMGVDFKPYLIRILAAVKRNWLAVYPESARLGRKGRVQIQFAIARDGSVPKLVIALPSGTRALDLAAVAGVDSSTPFPPLPDDFQGSQVRLQFTFTYNMK
jgi:TonB family protein